MTRTSNIACVVNSWRPCQSHHVRRIWHDKEELRKKFLEGFYLPRVQCPSFNPISWHLAQIEWAVFGTLTFSQEHLTYDNPTAEDLRQKECHRLIACACTKHRLKQRRLLYFGKTEWGSANRGHYNFLIGKDGTESVAPKTLADTMQKLWTGSGLAKGTARIEPFRQNLHLEGIFYQSKNEFDATGRQLNNTELFSFLLKKRMERNSARN